MFNTLERMFSIVEGVHYYEETPSVLWRMFSYLGISSVLWVDTISTLEGFQHYGGELQALIR